jgi:DNA ligase-1
MDLSPMLSYNKPFSLEEVEYPLAASFKYDGIRAVVGTGGRLLSRTLTRIPNKEVRKWLEAVCWPGVDGELVVGDPRAPDCYNRTSSQIMTRDGGAAGVRFFVFDDFSVRDSPYETRLELLYERIKKFCPGDRVVRVVQTLVRSPAEAARFRDRAVRLGYEGMMLRSLEARYKFGRSTLGELGLLKVKLAEDSEALVLSVFPRMRNENEQRRDARGYAKRSHAKAGKVATEELGGFRVRDVKTGVEFECAPGLLTQAQRKALWRMRSRLPRKIIKYRFQPAGAKDKPRFPRCIGFRSQIDF